ncbi:MAG: hypothetical protein RJA81_1103 [Planctomycetota bacterium]|jgi:hypothetical protein
MKSFLMRVSLATAIFCIVHSVSLTKPLQAASMSSVPSLGFTTSGQIGSEGITGINALSFKSQNDPVWGTTGTRYLGQFLVAPLPNGVTTSYNNTPFSVSILPLGLQVNDIWYTNTEPIVLKGRLNGTVTGNTYSSLVATFDPVDPWVDIVQGGVPNYQTFLTGVGPFLVNPDNSTQVSMNWMLVENVVPVPEPSTIIVISSGLSLFWVARRKQWI